MNWTTLILITCGVFTSTFCATIDVHCDSSYKDGFCFSNNLIRKNGEEFNFLTNTKSSRDKRLYVGFEGSMLKKISSEIFTAYKYASILYVPHCEIVQIYENTFKYANSLKYLIMKNNKISILENFTFNGAENLESLDLSFNEIEELPNLIFSKLIKLNDLDLSNNKIKNLDAQIFSSLTKLETLVLSNNKLTVISPMLFSQNIKITHLDLSENQLTDVELAIKNLEKLKYLDLSGNSLVKLDNYPESIKHLYINENKLTKLVINKNVGKLKAMGNPITEMSVKSYTTITDLYIDEECMLNNFGEINKLTNLEMLGNETDPIFVTDEVRAYLKMFVILLTSD